MTTAPLPSAAEAAHLTEVLRRAGVLGAGRVRAVEVISARPTILSHIIRLRLDYDGAPGTAPATLILKTAHPERRTPGWDAGRQELAFYNQVAGAMTRRVVPRCFEGHWEKESEEITWHLLLEDLTETHAAATAWPLPPSPCSASASCAPGRNSMPHGGTIRGSDRRSEPSATAMA